MSVFWWIELYLASLKVNAMSSNVFWVVYVLGIVWAIYLLMGRVVFLFCLRIGIRHLALKLAGRWVASGLIVEMEAFGTALAN